MFATLRFIVATLAIALFLLACETNQGPAEKAGERIDEAAEEVGDEVEEIGDEIEERTDSAEEG